MDKLVIAQEFDPEAFSQQVIKARDLYVSHDPAILQTTKIALNKTDVSDFLASTPIRCVPEIPTIMSQPEPPSIAFIKTLPSVFDIPRPILRQSMLAYMILLEKPGQTPRTAVGSAACMSDGAVKRVDQLRLRQWLARYVQKALDEGYIIEHIGVLLLLDAPSVTRQPIQRAFTLLFEAHYTFGFWTVREGITKKSENYYWGFCQWEKNQFEYDGTNGHSPLREPVRDLDLTEQEFEDAQRIKEENKKESQSADYFAKMDIVASVKGGSADMSDEHVQTTYDKHMARLKTQRVQRGQAKEVEAKVKISVLAEDSPEAVRALRILAPNQLLSETQTENLRLYRKFEAQDIDEADLTPELEKRIKSGKGLVKRRETEAQKIAAGNAILKRLKTGDQDESVLTIDQRSAVHVAQRKAKQNAIGKARQKDKLQRAKPLLDAHKKGLPINPDDQELLEWALNHKKVQAANNQRRAAKKRKAEDVDDSE